MRNKWKSGISCILAAAMVVGSLATAAPMTVAADTVEEIGTYYYIDPNGDDTNDGKSPETPWKSFANLATLKLTAGDQVLLKSGGVWNNEKLFIEGAEGTPDNPVSIGCYGDADAPDPIINGNGNPWNDDKAISSLAKEDVAVVHVKNSKYITIQDLEVTNWESDEEDLMGEKSPEYDQSKSMLTGILVENCDAGNIEGIEIKNNYVHDVNGYMSKNGSEGHKKGSGGIMVLVTTDDKTTKSYYTGLRITGNKVENVCHEAIYMESCWAARTLVGGANSQQAGTLEWVGWPEVYVAENYVYDVAGDGIVLINADGGIAENNLTIGCASEDWSYSRNPAHAAIWMWDCNNVTMQYNEAAYTESTQDGMAFDSDYGNQNVMFQYNYSHNNKGGFWMACPGPYYTVNSVVRYNVSINDGGYEGGRILHVGEYGSIGNQVYNNTMYWNNGYGVAAVEQGGWTSGVYGTVAAQTSGTDIYNNIFYGCSGTFIDNAGTTYNNNCVWGAAKDSYLAVVDDANAIIADPKLVDVEDFTTGTFGVDADGNGKVTRGTVNGFRLAEGSPCIDAGMDYMAVPQEKLVDSHLNLDELVDTHIKLANKDYDGNAVPYDKGKVDIGAFEFAGKAAEVVPVETDKAYLQTIIALSDTYKEDAFEASSWPQFVDTLKSAKTINNRADALQVQVDSYVNRLENAMIGLKQLGVERPGTANDDILESYASSSSVNNATFESSATDWGYWQASVSVSDDIAHSGDKSLKVVQSTAGTTGFSELGRIPVAANTAYRLEAWVYCTDGVGSLGLEAKHHNSYAGSDIKLNSMSLAADAETDENGWAKAVMEFTTQGYEMISVAISSNSSIAYVDDVVLYPVTVSSALDRKEIETTLKLVPEQKEAYYSNGSWARFAKAYEAAKILRIDAMASQEDINAGATELQEAFAGLTKKANFIVLEALYEVYSVETQGNFTDDSWKIFQSALTAAKAVLDNENATQAEVDAALDKVKTTRNALTLKVEKLNTITLKSAKAQKGKKLLVKWAKDTTVDGYEVQLSLKKNFNKIAKKTTVKGGSKASVTIKKLKKGKKYSVRIRSYKTVNGEKIYSDWSKVKTSGKIK